MELADIEVAPERAGQFRLRLWRGPLNANLVDSLRRALKEMYQDSHIDFYLSPKGYTDHTWEQIVAAVAGNGELWLGFDDRKVVGFLLGAYSKEIDNEMTYVIKQAWISSTYRSTVKPKEILRTVLDNAKSNFCRHVLIVSSRNPKAYLRWLGNGWKQVSTILKGDL